MNNIYYCTVSQTRGLSAEMPVGDPYGYGKKQMPVVIVALAAYSFAAGAAIATAVGASMAAMVVGGAMMVGAALTIVGTITGSKDLTKVGGILSLAGGIGALGAGAAGGLTAGAAEASAADGAVQLSGPGMVDGVADVATTGATDGATQLSGPGMDGVADTATAGGSQLATPGDTAATSSAASQPATDAAQQAAADANAAVDPSTSAFSTQSADAMAPSTNNAFQVTGSNDISGGLMQSGGTAPTGTASTGGYFDKAGTWIKANKDITKIGVDVLGGLLPTGRTQAETDYINAQAELSKQKLADNKRRALWSRGLIG